MTEKPPPAMGLFGDLSRLETPQSLSDSLEELNRRGHASTAMMISTRLDNWLEGTIKENFANNSRRLSDKLFGFRDPLGSFSAKIDIAFAMGAIGRESYKRLHVIRDIRNGFAHTDEEMDFYSSSLDKHFDKLPLERDREVVFVQAAVDCINDIKEKLRSNTLARLLQEHSSDDIPRQQHTPEKGPTQDQT